MRKTNILIAIVILLFLGFGLWYLLDSQIEKENRVKILVEDPSLVADDLPAKITCESEGGMWVDEREFCQFHDSERAEQLKLSCENSSGEWLSDSSYYECLIDGEIWQHGDWEIIDIEHYGELKQSCLEAEGEWLGGIEPTCMIKGDVFKQGQWLALESMEKSCVDEFQGEWLGGEKMECKIEGVVYPGNWVQFFNVKETCEREGGTLLAGEDNECQIGADIFKNQSWERLEEMRQSCESIGGDFQGGLDFGCLYQDKIYYYKNWEIVIKSDDMAKACLKDGGTWDSEAKACHGLSLDWCLQIETELNIGGVAWNKNKASCSVLNF